MADKKPEVTHRDALDALLAAVVESTEDGSYMIAKEYALAYRLIKGGTQPGSAIVESK